MAHANKHHDPHDSIHYEHDLDEHDSWFRHSSAEPHHQHAHGETKGWMIVGFMGGTLGLVLLVGAVVYWSFFEPLVRHEVEQKNEMRPVNAQYVSLQTDWQGRLKSYEWSDPVKGRVRIPLELASKLVIEDYARSRKP